jgi:hypothetical protein
MEGYTGNPFEVVINAWYDIATAHPSVNSGRGGFIEGG